MADLLPELTDEEYECAFQTGEERLKNGPVAVCAYYDTSANALVVELSTGCSLYPRPSPTGARRRGQGRPRASLRYSRRYGCPL